MNAARNLLFSLMLTGSLVNACTTPTEPAPAPAPRIEFRERTGRFLCNDTQCVFIPDPESSTPPSRTGATR